MALQKPSVAERLAAEQKRKAQQKRINKVRSKAKGLTIRQIVANTPSYIRYNGGFVSPTKLKFDPKTKTYLCETRTDELGQKPRKHKQEIQLLSGNKISDKGALVKIWCDCDFHCYTCEVALHLQGAADIRSSNGELPHVTNAKLIPLGCKHIFVLATKLIKGNK